MPQLLLIALLLTATLTGCSGFQKKQHVAPESHILLTMPSPNRMGFSGKGAGAGMMLMSSLGPAGIAVGVAIDQGIAKDIQTPFEQGGQSMEAIVTEAISERWGNSTQVSVHNTAMRGPRATTEAKVPPSKVQPSKVQLNKIQLNKVQLNIEGYGFKISQGEKEKSQGYFYGQLQCGENSSGKTQVLPFRQEGSASAPLAQLKSDGALTARLLKQVVKEALQSVPINSCDLLGATLP